MGMEKRERGSKWDGEILGDSRGSLTLRQEKYKLLVFCFEVVLRLSTCTVTF